MIAVKKLSLSVIGFAVAALFLIPYFRMFITAVSPKSELNQIPANYFPSSFEFGNFIEVFNAAPVATYIRNTLIISVAATLLVMLVSIPAAYYLARFKFKGRGAILFLVLITQMFAPTSLVIGLYREFVALGMVNNFMSLILVNAAFNLAFSVWILSGFFSAIPAEIEEAAMLDGCSRFTVLTRVTLPMALPGLVTAVIFTFIAAWNEFVIALTLTSSPELRPLTVGITNFIGLYEVQWTYLFAVSLIAIVPVVILFMFIEKWLVSGLTAGGIK